MAFAAAKKSTRQELIDFGRMDNPSA